jgi:hypothetical protein
MTKAEDMVAAMIANPSKYIKHPTTQAGKSRKERITVNFPGPVEVRYWSDPSTGHSSIVVEPREDASADLTTVDLAALLGTTPQRLRAILRDLGHGVGSANRYNIAALAPDFAKIRRAVAQE